MKMKKKAVGKLVVIGMVPLIMIINLISKSFPDFIERYYSAGVNRPVRQFLSLITGMFLFSLAEILLPGLVIILIYLVAKVIVLKKQVSYLAS